MTAISSADKKYFRNIIKRDFDKLNYAYEKLVVNWCQDFAGQHILMVNFKVEHKVQSKNMYDLFFVDGIKHLDLSFGQGTEFDWRKPQVWSLWTGIWFSDLSAFCSKLKFKKEFLDKTIGDVFHDDPDTIFRNFVNMHDGKFQLMQRWSSYTEETKELVFETWCYIKDMMKLEPVPDTVKIKFYSETDLNFRDWKLNKLLNS